MMNKTQPRNHKARSVPYAFQDKVVAELSRLEQENIKRKIDHTDWSPPIVVVPTAKKTRDNLWRYQVNTNPNVELEHCPVAFIPRVDPLLC